jgi:hypothetical protein
MAFVVVVWVLLSLALDTTAAISIAAYMRERSVAGEWSLNYWH